MKRFYSIMILFVVVLGLFSCGKKKVSDKKNDKIYTVGITQYNDSELNVEIRKGIVQGLREYGFKEGDNIIYKNQQAKNNNSYVTQINKKFVEDKCDMIVAIGSRCTMDAIDVCNGTDTKVVYAAVSDPKALGLCDKDLNPILNTTGTIDKYNASKNLSLIKGLFPYVKNVGIMYTKNETSSKKVVDEYKYYASKNDVDIITIAINTEKDIELAYDALVKKVDAILIVNDNVIESNADYIIEKSIAYRKPIFASNNMLVKKGAIAGHSIDLLELGKETGKIASDILKNADPKLIKVKSISDTVLYVNKKTLDIYNIAKDNSLIKDATIYE